MIGREEDEHKSADLGKIVNLMQSVIFSDKTSDSMPILSRGDSYAVAQRFWQFSGIFTSPIRLGIALAFLYQYVMYSIVSRTSLLRCLRILGWSALSGIIVILLAYVFNYPLAQYNIFVSDRRICQWRSD